MLRQRHPLGESAHRLTGNGSLADATFDTRYLSTHDSFAFAGLGGCGVPRGFDLPELFRMANCFISGEADCRNLSRTWYRSSYCCVTGHYCQGLPTGASMQALSTLALPVCGVSPRHDRHTGLPRSAWSLDPRRARPAAARVRAVLGQRCANAWPHGAGGAGKRGPRPRDHKPERRR